MLILLLYAALFWLGAIEGCSVSLSVFSSGKFPFVFFFLKKGGNVLSLFIQKV